MTVLKRLIPLLQFTTGQRLRLLRRLRAVVVELGLLQFLPQIDRAIAHELFTQGLENQWAGHTSRALYADPLGEIDTIVDRLLAGIRGIVRGQAQGLPAHDPVAVMCEDFQAEVFPNGLNAIISLPYVEQVAAVEVILGKLQGELADAVRQLGLEAKRDQLIELNAEYQRLIHEGRREVRFADVREGRRRGQELLREIAATILAQFHDSTDPAQVDAREALLNPLIVQLDETTARTRAIRRAAGAPEDGVDGIDEVDDVGDVDEADLADDASESDDVADIDDVEAGAEPAGDAADVRQPA